MKLIRRISLTGIALATTALITGCTNPNRTTNATAATVPKASQPITIGRFTPTLLENGEASHITVQHILIGFEDSVPGKGITRTKEQAETLAKDLLAKAQSGENFDQLVVSHTDDSPPGIYHMANFNQESDMNAASADQIVFARDGMVTAFGDVGFPLEVGGIGIAEYDPEKSKYGWHIIKRLK